LVFGHFACEGGSLLWFSLNFKAFREYFLAGQNLRVPPFLFVGIVGILLVRVLIGLPRTVIILDVFVLEIQERINFTDWTLIIESGLIAVVQVLRVARIFIVCIFEVQSRSFSCVKFFT
jgi:hypothetical protein